MKLPEPHDPRMSLSEAQGLKVAKELVRTVGRAFFADDAVVVLDALVDDAYLRDDELSERFQLPSKQMRSVLQRLQHEKLVSCEDVLQAPFRKMSTLRWRSCPHARDRGWPLSSRFDVL